MGKKVHPTIFRIDAKYKNWQFLYFSKNNEDTAYYVKQSLDIRQLLDRVFESNNVLINNCIISRSNLKIKISISFYVTSKVVIKSLLSSNKIFKIKKQTQVKKKFLQSKSIIFLKSFKKILRARSLLKFLKLKKLENIRQTQIKISEFRNSLINTLSAFTGCDNVTLNFRSIQNVALLKIIKQQSLKIAIKELNNYSRENFFKETIEILILMCFNKNMAILLCKFIIFQMQHMKRHNNFLIFLKRALLIFIGVRYSKLLGVKITISGRFNGVPRAKSRTLHAGTVPLQTRKLGIDYYSDRSYTKYGVFGIKIWVCEKI
jgi:ribosomal protein S3